MTGNYYETRVSSQPGGRTLGYNPNEDSLRSRQYTGGCHDKADAEWIVIRAPLRSHNDTPFRWPTPAGLLATLGRIWRFQLLLID
jgi:hypothetical protein